MQRQARESDSLAIPSRESDESYYSELRFVSSLAQMAPRQNNPFYTSVVFSCGSEIFLSFHTIDGRAVVTLTSKIIYGDQELPMWVIKAIKFGTQETPSITSSWGHRNDEKGSCMIMQGHVQTTILYCIMQCFPHAQIPKSVLMQPWKGIQLPKRKYHSET